MVNKIIIVLLCLLAILEISEVGAEQVRDLTSDERTNVIRMLNAVPSLLTHAKGCLDELRQYDLYSGFDCGAYKNELVDFNKLKKPVDGIQPRKALNFAIAFDDDLNNGYKDYNTLAFYIERIKTRIQ